MAKAKPKRPEGTAADTAEPGGVPAGSEASGLGPSSPDAAGASPPTSSGSANPVPPASDAGKDPAAEAPQRRIFSPASEAATETSAPSETAVGMPFAALAEPAATGVSSPEGMPGQSIPAGLEGGAFSIAAGAAKLGGLFPAPETKPTEGFPSAEGGLGEVLSQSEVERLLTQVQAEETTATILKPGGERSRIKNEDVQPCDFRQPAFLTGSELRKIRLRHEEFIRSLAAHLSISLRLEVVINMSKLQTLGYQKYTESLANPTHLTLFKVEPFKGVCLLEMSPASV